MKTMMVTVALVAAAGCTRWSAGPISTGPFDDEIARGSDGGVIYCGGDSQCGWVNRKMLGTLGPGATCEFHYHGYLQDGGLDRAMCVNAPGHYSESDPNYPPLAGVQTH